MITRILLKIKNIIDGMLTTRGVQIVATTDQLAPVDIGFVDSMNDQLGGWFDDNSGALYSDFLITADDQVLDVGCGNGRYLFFCAEQGAHVSWVDIEEHKVEAMKAALQDSSAASLSGYVSDCQPMPFDKPFATKIIASEVMEHVDSPAQFLSELYRIGLPGATYLITVPHQKSEETQKSFAPKEYFEKPNHINIFSEEEVETLINQAGFEIISQENTGFYQAIWWLFIWICPGEGLSTERVQNSALMRSWVQTWSELLKNERGAQVKKILDNVFPKRRVIVARKPL
jgi:2-polyprenyl-3-methyl-5-hydroxy-6-metoxy-1,4-benzoquinol methylase